MSSRDRLAAAGHRWHDAKTSERAAMSGLYAAIRDAVADGVSESEAARIADVDRMTVRRALGKM